MTKTQDLDRRPSFSMRLENFRLFKDSEWFRVAPLTCLVGRNSSGKTSILSALLLLKQSLEQEGMARGTTPLILSGPYCDLGDYGDLVYNHDQSSEVSFSFAMSFLDLQTRTSQAASPLTAFPIPRSNPVGRLGFGYYYPRYEATLPKSGEVTASLTFSVSKPFGPSLSCVEIQVPNVGSARFIRTISGERRQHWRTYTTALAPKIIDFTSGPRSLFPGIMVRERVYQRSSPEQKTAARLFAHVASLLFRHLQRTLWDSRVIGPFRTPPERRYAFGGFGASRGGPSGEQAVNLLITEALLRTSAGSSLEAAVAFWIKHLKLAKSLRVKDIAKRLNLFEVDVRGTVLGARANLADVGFGVSQILPVLVEGLLMRRGGIYLVQQPEIHLHPDAQAGLADFFIYLAANGVTTIVETHSEYFLLRLRRRLAEGGKSLQPVKSMLPVAPVRREDIAVLYTGSEQRQTVVKQLEIGESFQFENLPAGFMSQALDDRVALLRVLGKRNA